MKKIFLLLIMVLIYPNLFGQDYLQFNFESGVWICSEEIYGDEIKTYKIQYYTDGDTIINDTIYGKLMEYRISTEAGPGYGTMIYNGYCGAIRNADNKQVEYIPFDNNEPEIIYDFNLSIGDTIKIGYGADDSYPAPLIVVSIDSVEYCGNYHKCFNLNDISFIEQKLIEGIGFTSGLINPHFFQIEQSSSLICYSEKNNSLCDECELLLSNRLLVENHKIKLFPNPCSGIITVKSEELISEISVISQSGEIFDFNDNLQLPSKELKLDAGLETGTYIVRIKTINEEIHYKKLIVLK